MKCARLLASLPTLAALLICGCEEVPDGQMPTAPVEVTVIYKEKPVQEAIVTFVGPTPESPPAFGRTDANGKAQMTTYSTADGATLGTHSVSVVKQEFSNVKEDAPQDSPEYTPSPGASPLPVVKDLLPTKYSLPMTSGLTVNVEKGKKNELTLNLDEQPPAR